MRTIVLTFVAAMLLAPAFTTWADDAVKSSQPPYKPGRQIDDDSSSSAPTPQSTADSDQSVKSSRAPYKPGRAVDEKTDDGDSKK